jgi:hypothetical protein
MLSELAESLLESMLNMPPNQIETPEGRKIRAQCFQLVRAHCGRHEAMRLRYAYHMSLAASFPNA